MLEIMNERKIKWLGEWLWRNNHIIESMEGVMAGNKNRGRKELKLYTELKKKSSYSNVAAEDTEPSFGDP